MKKRMGQAAISGVILGFCALLMFANGIYQMKSKKPVGFYTGEKAPDEKELSDVNAWNRKHGAMWILYGLCIVLAWACGLFLDDGVILLVPFLAFLLLPIPFMILYHHQLEKEYRVR